jgi:hypothetical protein
MILEYSKPKLRDLPLCRCQWPIPVLLPQNMSVDSFTILHWLVLEQLHTHASVEHGRGLDPIPQYWKQPSRRDSSSTPTGGISRRDHDDDDDDDDASAVIGCPKEKFKGNHRSIHTMHDSLTSRSYVCLAEKESSIQQSQPPEFITHSTPPRQLIVYSLLIFTLILPQVCRCSP